MKRNTQESHYARVERVVEFLRDHVDKNPTLGTLADVAAISPSHFHRVYRTVTGETPSGTLRRMRLAKACFLLQDKSRPVTEVAFDVGFESAQSFAKAFRTATGFSPSEIRRNSKRLDSAEKLFSRPNTPATNKRSNIEINVVSVEPFQVIASRRHGPPDSLFSAFGELLEWAQSTGLAERLQGIYGIPIDDHRDTPEAVCRFDCCFDFGPQVNAPGKFRIDDLGGGEFVVARHVGPYDGLDDVYDYLYGQWINDSAYSLRDGPLFNHYLNDPDTIPPERWETDVYVPVEKTA